MSFFVALHNFWGIELPLSLMLWFSALFYACKLLLSVLSAIDEIKRHD